MTPDECALASMILHLGMTTENITHCVDRGMAGEALAAAASEILANHLPKLEAALKKLAAFVA